MQPAFFPQLRLTVLFTLLLLACAASPVLAQRDVHAMLIASAQRKPAPAFGLMNEAGRIVGVSDYRGKVVLLNFWATDCGGCVLEIPSFIAIESAYGAKAFTAVGISMDISYENLKNADEAWGKVKPFVSDHKVNYPILMGDESVFGAYGLNALPATFLIDKTGRIAAMYVGIVSKDNVEVNLNKLLSER